MIEIGQNAPGFAVLDHRGNVVRLSDYLGTNIILWFYPKADTPGWTIEGCEFRNDQKLYQDKNVQIFGISLDSPEENSKFAQKFNFNFPLLSDRTREVSVAYGACDSLDQKHAKRITCWIDAKGQIKKVYLDINPKEHSEQVLSDLNKEFSTESE